jgi:hypothetical protein
LRCVASSRRIVTLTSLLCTTRCPSAAAAGQVRCKKGSLQGATLSDHGYVIIRYGCVIIGWDDHMVGRSHGGTVMVGRSHRWDGHMSTHVTHVI